MKNMGPWLLAAAFLLVLGGAAAYRLKDGKPVENRRSYFVKFGDLRQTVKASGVVEPKNKVEILPPVSGRVDEVLADQGQNVKKGQPLAWMSSTDRAALFDAALAQGPTVFARWERAYRATPILAPVRGMIIERNVVEGQTVTPTQILFVLADRLIIRARVDESEIGKIRIGQKTELVAEAFPEKPFEGHVRLVDYQARRIGGVSAYAVELDPRSLPAGVRSGMTVRAEFIMQTKESVMLLPLWALKGAHDATVPLQVRRGDSEETVQVKLGLSDGTNVEVVSGLSLGDEIRVEAPDFGAKSASNLFSPFGRAKKKKKKRGHP